MTANVTPGGLTGWISLDIQYPGLTGHTKDRTWKAVSRCKVATDMINEGR